jgi:rhodanese-related sulfurtransferase
LLDVRNAAEYKNGHIAGAPPFSIHQMFLNDSSIEGYAYVREIHSSSF